MAVAFRSDNDVTNGTAGTSVTVTKPLGIVDTGDAGDRDHLVAFISCTGTTTITPPAGWTLVDSAVDAGNNVTLWCYTKLASSEGASWTWTLGASRRNWGWVGAYTGVDPDSPVASSGEDLTIASSTILDGASATLSAFGLGVSAGSAVRTASGSATTWTHSSTERADVSTNGGAGTDIAGVVGDTATESGGTYLPILTASQNQTAGVSLAASLNPYFFPYSAAVGGLGLIIEAAFGGDPEGDQSEWTWTDITSLVLYETKVILRHGLRPPATSAPPSEMHLTLKNLNGEFTHPTGTYADQFVRNLPIRVRANGFGLDVGGDGYHFGTFYLSSAVARWEKRLRFAVVDVVANGLLRRLQRRLPPAKSPAYAAIMGQDPARLVAYWPFEDGSDAASAASPIPGVAPARLLNVDLGATAEGTGASSFAQLSATSDVEALVPAYTHSGGWTAGVVMNIPAEPASSILILEVLTDGTAPRWQISIVAGSPATLRVQAFDSAVATILTDTVSITDESVIFGSAVLFTLSTQQNGTGVDYVVEASIPGSGFSKSGTLASRTNGAVTKFRMASAGYTTDRFGHLWLFNNVEDLGFGFIFNDPVLAGNAGEWDWARFQRLCTEAGIPFKSDAYSDRNVEMGAQPTAQFMAHMREIEIVGGVVVTDSGHTAGGSSGVLWLPALDDRYNVEPALTLDRNLGQVVDLGPSLDDTEILNDSTYSRDDGSFARAVDQDSVNQEGRYEDGAIGNVYLDDELQHLAQQRVNVGTADGWRYPQVKWDLRRSPELVQDWVNATLFTRLDILNPPSQYPPEDIRSLLQGYTQTLARDRWEVVANLSPYEPYEVFELAETSADQNEWAGRLAGDDNAATRGAIDDNDLSIPFDPNAYRWTTVADDFDPDLKVRLYGNRRDLGEVVEVSSIATTAATFVAAGTTSHADNAAVTPGINAGATTSDWIFVFARHRSSGTLSITTGYTLLAQTRGLYLWAKVHDGSESNPTVTPSGGVAGDTVSAITFGFRGLPVSLEDMADAVVKSVTLINSSAANIAYPGIYPKLQEGCVILLLAGRSDDWTSVAVPSGLTEITEAATTTGDDQGFYAAYQIQTTPAVVNDGTLTVTGGGAANNESMILAIAGGYQTMTISARGVNGFSKAWAAGTKVEVEDAYVLGL